MRRPKDPLIRGVSTSTNGENWTESILWNFNGTDGAEPVAGLITDSHGNLYGSTFWRRSFRTGDGVPADA